MSIVLFAAALVHAATLVVIGVLALLLLFGLTATAITYYVVRDLYHLYLWKKELRDHLRSR